MDGNALIDVPRSGAVNMAIDQRMLERAAELQTPLLRLYQWSEPTLSLGYFQKIADRLGHAPSRQLDVVRRATGGGAIVHHHDWTYSLALPSSLLKPGTAAAGSKNLSNKNVAFDIGAAQGVYDCVHDAVVGWLIEKGWEAGKWQLPCNTRPAANAAAPGCSTDQPPQTQRTAAQSSCRFLCFERRSPGDVMVGTAKVMGSAQRRRQGALLQHGSLLLAQSPHAPSLVGLAEFNPVAAQSLEIGDFFDRLRAAVSDFSGQVLTEVQSVVQLIPGIDATSGGNYLETTWTGRV